MFSKVKAILPQREWAKRFAYRAMLMQPSIDSLSARLLADSQFDDAGDLEPEAAAEIFTSQGAWAAPSAMPLEAR